VNGSGTIHPEWMMSKELGQLIAVPVTNGGSGRIYRHGLRSSDTGISVKYSKMRSGNSAQGMWVP